MGEVEGSYVLQNLFAETDVECYAASGAINGIYEGLFAAWREEGDENGVGG